MEPIAEAVSHTVPGWPSTTSVTVVDVTPRDGLQDADRSISPQEKLAFIAALVTAGVRHIEATAFMHPTWIPQLADADEVAARLPRHDGVVYSALVPNLRGFERARAAGITALTLVISASESHNHANLNRSVADSLAQLTTVVEQAQANGLTVRGSVATAFGCPFEGAVSPASVLRIMRVYAALGVAQVSLADTIGAANPRQVYELFRQVREEVAPATVLSAHFHDRSGYGLANVFAALQAGVTVFDGAVGGLGGCPYAPGAPGNLSTEALIAYLGAMGLATGIDPDGLAAARDLLMAALRRGEPVRNDHSLRHN